MKKAVGYKTTTYETGIENFLIDIVEQPEHFPNGETEVYYIAWLYRENIGVKHMAIGTRKEPGQTVRQVAKDMINYCLIDWERGTMFEFYDELYN